MGLSANTRTAIRNALGTQAANEVLPLLDILKEKIEGDQKRAKAQAQAAAESPASQPAPATK